MHFETYNADRKHYLATLHKFQQIQVRVMKKNLEFQYMTRIMVTDGPECIHFIPYNHIFVVTYETPDGL